jgi:ATP-dependent helicase YprA (DUF1998 family)
MKQTPHGSFNHIKEALIQYLETQYKIADTTIYNERGEILRAGDKIAQIPFIEATPNFTAGNFLSELERTNESIPAGISDLVRHGVPVDRHRLYKHQEEALLATFSDRPNLLVATGTGSGKTEAFLLPILAKILNESRQWNRPTSESLHSGYDVRMEKWLNSRRRENRPAALRSIILYPMNALVNDQLTRLRRILSLGNSPTWQRANLNGNLIHFGMYTSLTPVAGSWGNENKRRSIEEYLASIQQDWDNLPQHHQDLGGWPRPNASEMLTRWDMQDAPPDILVTNYSMLEYMLMRPIEGIVFDQTREWLASDENAHFTLVLDEAHSYSGAKGTEVAHLIRRLKERLGLESNRKFQAIATTASVPLGSDNLLTSFTGSLFGVEDNSFTLIRAATTNTQVDGREGDNLSLQAFANFQEHFELNNPRPAIETLAQDLGLDAPDFTNGDEVALFNLIRENPYVEWVRKNTARNATPLNEIENNVWLGDIEPQIRELSTAGLLAAGSFARADGNKGTPPLLSLRLHAFFRGLPGLWACMDPDCSCADNNVVRHVGKIYTEPRPWCDCGARVLEVFTCRHCGLMFLGGIPDSHANSLWPWSDSLTGERDEIRQFRVFGVERPDASWQPSHRSTRSTLQCDDSLDTAREVYEVNPTMDNGVMISPFPGQCPRCQRWRQPGTEGREVIEPLRTKGIQSFATIVEENYRFQPLQTSDEPNFGKKSMVFSDSRREASKLANDLKQNHHNELFRQCLYHTLYACKTCEGTGIEKVEQEGPPRIGKRPEEREIICRTCSGSKLDPAPATLGYQQIKTAVLALQFKKGIDPSRQRITNVFTQLEEDGEGTYAKAELFFNADLFKEITDEVYSLEPLGLAKWEVPILYQGRVVTDIGNFPGLNTIQSYQLLQASIRLLATERVVTAAEPATPWEWGKDDEGEYILPNDRRNTTQRLFGVVQGAFGRVIPFNVTENRKLGRYIIAISCRLLETGVLQDDNARLQWVRDMDDALWESLTTQLRVLTPAGQRFNVGSRQLVPFGIRLNKFSLSPLPQDQIHQCQSCKYVMSIPLLDVCMRCGQRTAPIAFEDIRNYFKTGALYANPTNDLPDPYPFKASEHTAQVDSTEARNEERWFQDIFHDDQNPYDHRVDALSVTTTMEMGIDIGSLLFVGLRNVPPAVANYQQRAGRAGRRGSALASVYTFSQPRSHDQYYFKKPKAIVSDPPRVPSLHFANEVIARRHFRALILQSFFDEVDLGDQQLFNIWGSVRYYLDNNLNRRLEAFIHTNRRELIVRSQAIISPILYNQIQVWLQVLPVEIQSYCQSKDNDDQLFVSLLNSGMLPKYAFPVDVVSLSIPNENINHPEDDFTESMQRDLKIAIAEYAPGAEITKQTNQRTYKYTSVGIHDPFDTNPNYVSQGAIVECLQCQNIIVLDGNNPAVPAACPVCQSGDLSVMQFIRPRGFTVDGSLPYGGRVAYNSLDGLERGPLVSAAKLMMGENTVAAAGRQNFFDGRLNTLVNIGDLVIVNKGRDRTNPGFCICQACGRELDPADQNRHRRPADVPPNRGFRPGPRKGSYCTNEPPYSQDKLVLSHKFHSEVLLLGINLPDELDAPFRDSSGFAIWFSFGTLVANAAARVLQIDPSEIKVGVRPINRGGHRIHGEVFLYDDVPGGAGYARSILSNLDEIFQVAREIANECLNPECTGACYQCMLDYKNQSFHHILSRDLGLSLLNYVLDGLLPQITLEEIEMSVNSFADYARVNFENLGARIIAGINADIAIRDSNGNNFALLIIHPLRARLSDVEIERIRNESGYNVKVFTSFDFIKRPFWVLNQLTL